MQISSLFWVLPGDLFFFEILMYFCSCFFQACVKRVEADTTGHKHCTGQYFDFWSCIDKCVCARIYNFMFLSGVFCYAKFICQLNVLIFSFCRWHRNFSTRPSEHIEVWNVFILLWHVIWFQLLPLVKASNCFEYIYTVKKLDEFSRTKFLIRNNVDKIILTICFQIDVGFDNTEMTNFISNIFVLL